VKALERPVTVAGMPEDSPVANRRGSKSAGAFRTISEVAGELDVPQHVLRFWETRFTQIRPLKRAGGRRYYRPEDVELLRRIRGLLYQHGYTIKGVQKLLRDGGRATDEPVTAVEDEPETQASERSARPSADGVPRSSRQAIEAVIEELGELRDLLQAHRR
jgi:DNA-binding transcriptional MerR regulator